MKNRHFFLMFVLSLVSLVHLEAAECGVKREKRIDEALVGVNLSIDQIKLENSFREEAGLLNSLPGIHASIVAYTFHEGS